MEARDVIGSCSEPSSDAVNAGKRSAEKRIKCARSAHVDSSIYIYMYIYNYFRANFGIVDFCDFLIFLRVTN